MHNKDNNITIVWDMPVNTDRTITANRLDIAVNFHRQKCKLALMDFTVSNDRRFYSSMGKPSAAKGLKIE